MCDGGCSYELLQDRLAGLEREPGEALDERDSRRADRQAANHRAAGRLRPPSGERGVMRLNPAGATGT